MSASTGSYEPSGVEPWAGIRHGSDVGASADIHGLTTWVGVRSQSEAHGQRACSLGARILQRYGACEWRQRLRTARLAYGAPPPVRDGADAVAWFGRQVQSSSCSTCRRKV